MDAPHEHTAEVDLGDTEQGAWRRTPLWRRGWRVTLCGCVAWNIWLALISIVQGRGNGLGAIPDTGYALAMMALPPLPAP